MRRIPASLLLPALLGAATAVAATPPNIGGCEIFPANNVWNTPVDKLAVHPESNAWVATLNAWRPNLHPDFGAFFDGDPIGIPFVTVPGSQAPVPIVFTAAGDESDPGPYPIPPSAPIEGGAASGGDRHVLVVDAGDCVLYELFRAFPQNGGASWVADSGAVFDLGSNALRPDTWTSADAAGLPILPGLVRYDESQAGEINHALRFTAPQTRGAYIWPARHEASSLTGSQYPPLGARFRLKASFDISGFSPQNQAILRALKKYGMILADNGSAWFISGEHNPLWSNDSLNPLKSVPGSAFEAVDTAPLQVAANSGQSFVPPPDVALTEIASGLSSPIGIANAGDGSNRLFVIEKGGRVRVIRNGAVLPTPFLDITSKVAAGAEQGLLGLAFHPQYATNRRFFLFYTQAGTGALRVSSFLATAFNPDVADPASEKAIITVPHASFANHNGGHLAFGPDGYLYIATGDGGGGGDPGNNAQNRSSRLGKILRLDVDFGSPYSIPPGNPFAAGGGAPEVFHYGLRNPWRFSFDRSTGDFFVGDVGQNAVEEIDFLAAGSAGGANFGWRVFEGTRCFNPSTACALSGHRPPILQYAHDAAGGSSVTGGYVYRGSRSATLRGYYLFADFGSGRVWAGAREGNAWAKFILSQPPSVISGPGSFGEDEAGEVYLASMFSGRIHRLDGAGPAGPVLQPLVVDGPQPVSFDGNLRADLAWRHLDGRTGAWAMNGLAIDSIVITPGTSSLVPRLSGDFDGDGDTDFILRADDGVHAMSLMSATAAAAPVDLYTGNEWDAIGVGDFDGDGKDDLLWKSRGGAYGMWIMDGVTTTSVGVVAPPAAGFIVDRIADFDGDGRADLLWRKPDGTVTITLMNGLAAVETGNIFGPDAGWRPVLSADFDANGKADLLWKHTNGSHGIWLMDGVTRLAFGSVLGPGTGWVAKLARDLDGDNKADLVWAHTNGAQGAWLVDGIAISQYAQLIGPGSGWSIAGAGDFNGDGKADLAWRHSNGSYGLWIMDGLAFTSFGTVLPPGTGWRLAP